MSTAAVLLAESDSGKGSPIGLFVVLLLVIAVYLLYRSMTGHLRRLPEKFPQPVDTADGGTDKDQDQDQDQAAPPDTGAASPDANRTGPS